MMTMTTKIMMMMLQVGNAVLIIVVMMLIVMIILQVGNAVLMIVVMILHDLCDGGKGCSHTFTKVDYLRSDLLFRISCHCLYFSEV